MKIFGKNVEGEIKNWENCIKNGVKGLKIASLWVIDYKNFSRESSASPPPPPAATLYAGEKIYLKVGAGGIIEMHNIYPR